MNRYSVELYRSLQPGDNPPGWVRVRQHPARVLDRSAGRRSSARPDGRPRAGLELQQISAAEAQELFPLMSTDGVVGAAYLPTDGQVDPSQLTYSLAAGARAMGVAIHTHTRVLGIDTEGEGLRRRVTRVRTDKGDIECELVVDCGGMFAAEIARMVGVRVPIVPMSHQYVVTEAMFEHRETPLPSLRDPDLLVYYRQEVDGLVMGGYERQSLPWTASRVVVRRGSPPDFNGRLLQPRPRPLRRDQRERRGARAVDRRRRHPLVHQRPRGVHARQRVLPRADRRRRLLRRGRASARTASPAPAASAR